MFLEEIRNPGAPSAPRVVVFSFGVDIYGGPGMKLAVSLTLVALTAALALTASPAYAQIELTELDPPAGARLDAPPDLIYLCFSQPVIFEDNTAFDFRFFRPDGTGMGHRDRFDLDGECLDITVNVDDDYEAGRYTLEWQVTAAQGDEVGSGTLSYQVTQGGTPAPSPSPSPEATVPPGTPVELTEVSPADGARLDEPPDVVHVCFSRRVVIDEPPSFDFRFVMPDGKALGRRTAFQPDGMCADVYPGLPDERPAGEYSIEWRVTAAEGDATGSGTLRFQVTQSSNVTPSPEPTVTARATPTPAPLESTDDDGPDILLAALITIGVVGGAALLFALAYLLRLRIGYEPHRPPEDGEGDEGH
jgi:methionine-rich copper-binding protein CopC